MSSESLGDLIRARRNEMGMTQARLADLVGVSSSTLSAWEQGQSEPSSDDSKMALAAVLGISDDLPTGSPSNNEGPNNTGPTHLEEQSTLGMAAGSRSRRTRGRRLRREDDDSASSGGGQPSEDVEVYGTPSFGEWLRSFDDPDPEPDADTESEEVAEASDTAKESGVITSILETDPVTALQESDILNKVKESDPLATVRESEVVTTIKDRISVFLRPRDEPDDVGAGESVGRQIDLEDVDSSHSLTEDVYYEPSYVEDPDEMDHYRNRWIITAFVVIVLLMVAFWSLGQAQAALAEGWERMFNMLNV